MMHKIKSMHAQKAKPSLVFLRAMPRPVGWGGGAWKENLGGSNNVMFDFLNTP